jgi:DNA-directed RNA polymerase subunit RPC12/RpoP
MIVRTQGTRRRNLDGVNCPVCGHRYASTSNRPPQTVECPRCGQSLTTLSTNRTQSERYVRYTGLRAGSVAVQALRASDLPREFTPNQTLWYDNGSGRLLHHEPRQQALLEYAQPLLIEPRTGHPPIHLAEYVVEPFEGAQLAHHLFPGLAQMEWIPIGPGILGSVVHGQHPYHHLVHGHGNAEAVRRYDEAARLQYHHL